MTEAVVRQVRDLLRNGDASGAQSLADSLREHQASAELGALIGGIVAAHRGFHDLAWELLEVLPASLWARFAADEYVRSGIEQAPDRTVREVGILADEYPSFVPAVSWLALCTVAFGAGWSELARVLFLRFSEELDNEPHPRPRLRQQREWLSSWLHRDPSSPMSPRSGRPSVAVIDYGHPGMTRASANIGDHVQSIASLGHLVRHQGVRFHGHQDLVELLEHLRARTRPEQQRSDVQGDVDVLTVHRDASMYQQVPEGTWVLCFGWFMHALFRMRYGFPLHDGLRPIFVSFHCNKRDLLNDDAIAYLRRYGPVGCRDWTTVYLLLSVGVPAFFSGCMTTTVSTVFPELPAGHPRQAPVAYVDIPDNEVPDGAPVYRHSSGSVRSRSFTENCYDALDLLEKYRREHSAVVTSRLHCYLPVRSLGTGVDFRPANRSDVRFDGLIDISDAAFEDIRTGIQGKLDQVYAAILSNATEDEVYSLWREITAAEVREAERRRSAELRLPSVPEALLVEVAEAVSRTLVAEPVALTGDDVGKHVDPIHCVVRLPRGYGRALETLVASLAAHASRPLHLWVLSQHQPARSLRHGLATAFPNVAFSWVHTRRIGRGLTVLGGETAPDLSLLALDKLLPDVSRVLVLPVVAVATADVAELADVDLGDTFLAAPTRTGFQTSGFGVVYRAAEQLGHRTYLAAALRRGAHARHTFDFDAFTTDLMVLDLDRMRQEGFVDQALPLVEEFGMSAPAVLHYLVGPQRTPVPANWCHVPTRTQRRGPGLTYWADEVRPWDSRVTAGRELWAEYSANSRR